MGRNQFSHNKIIDNKKKCNICQEYKELSLFHPNKECNGGVTGTCKECSKIRVRKWYSDNRKRRQEVSNKLNQLRKQDMVARFGNKCHDCHGTFPLCVYDFHHLDGSLKDMNPSKALSMNKENREKEFDKCILLCANCHRVRHFGRKDR